METTSLSGGIGAVSYSDAGRHTEDGFDRILGSDAGLSEAVHKARLLTNVDAPLLLRGETGVGKELFARAIHGCGRQRNRPFVAFNCGGLPRELLASELFGYGEGAFSGAQRAGKLEAANGGTLFLDEIGELPLDLQPYLLRVLEEGEVRPLGSTRPRKVQFRLIAASNRDLRAEVAAGRFRVELLYRVSVTSLRIPALRERYEDIPCLVQHFVREVADGHDGATRTFVPEVLEAFARYPWPGNVRELRNVVESMFLLSEGEQVTLSGLPEDLRASMMHADQAALGVRPPVAPVHIERGLRDLERNAIQDAVNAHAGNLTRAARELQIARSTLYLKLKKYGLESTLSELRCARRAPA